MVHEVGTDIGKEKLGFSTGYLAKQADGAVTVSYGDVVVFASVVVSRSTKEGQDFFPLTVDYREKFYAAGRFPGGFIKRESRPSDREVLTSRLADRPLRPLFPGGFLNEVQIIIYVLSADQKNQQDILAINAASAALMISGAPFNGPVGAVRVGRIDGQWIINPTYEESALSDIDLIVAGTKNAVTMIEGSSKNVTEDDMIAAVEVAHENIKKICAVLEEFRAAAGKPMIEYKAFVKDEVLKAEIKKRYYSELESLSSLTIKKQREDAFNKILLRAKDDLAADFPDTLSQSTEIIDTFDGEINRKRILDEGKRADGRGLRDIRPIDIKLGILPRVHGSAVFTRGETQSLGVTTLGTGSDAQRMDNLEGESEKRFMLHYHFPPFCVGETGRHGGVGRREIGHGMLAEKSIEYALPDHKDFPYTIRQVSEIFESNGSSSMATVCSASLSLFNAGAPMKSAVAGIAMGLILEGDKYAILSDILGIEDHLGDMDFKVAGTRDGITAFQLDIKIEGITIEIMKAAVAQAREGRLKILDVMDAAIASPEKELAEHSPKIKQISIKPDKIGELIGPGGRVIRKITEESGADINVTDDGTVTIYAQSSSAMALAEKFVKGIVDDVEVDQVYDGTVKRIMDFGAFVEILPGKEGLVHISKLDHKRVNSVTDVVKLGDKIKVKVIKIDNMGRIDLSHKDA
jgi:polyribonucleotide nucleotidyltransferase